MNRNKLFLIFLGLITIYIGAYAQTVSWIVKPNKYTSVEKVTNYLLRVQDMNYYGLIGIDGSTKINCEYEVVTDYKNGYCLALKQNKLFAIIDEMGNANMINEDLTVDSKYPYFSEGLLSVKDKNGKWGFITPNGTHKIDFKYQSAFPFSGGLATVRFSDNYFAPIDSEGKVLYLRNTLNNKDLSFLSSFSVINGRPLAVACVGNQVYLCDKNGNVIGNTSLGKTTGVSDYKIIITGRADVKAIDFDDKWRIKSITKQTKESGTVCDTYDYSDETPILVDSSIGHKKNTDNKCNLEYDGVELVPYQFDDVSPITNTIAAVKKGAFYGVATVDLNSKIDFKAINDHVSIHHHTEIPVSVEISGVKSDNYKVQVFCDKEEISSIVKVDNNSILFSYMLSGQLESSNSLSFSIIPTIDDIVYSSKDINITVDYSHSFRVSAPSKIQLNTENSCIINLTVTNRDSKDSDICSVYFDGSRVGNNVVIPAEKSHTFQIGKQIDLLDKDNVVKKYEVRVEEKGVNRPYSATVSIEFERYFTND